MSSKLYMKLWKLKNEKRYRRVLKRWRKANPKYNKHWLENNKEYVKKKKVEWRKKNPDKMCIYRARRKALLAKCGINDFTLEEWHNLLKRYKFKCAYCKIRKATHQEHVVPLSRKGNNTKSNIVPACSYCNQTKWNKTLEEMGWKDPRKRRK